MWGCGRIGQATLCLELPRTASFLAPDTQHLAPNYHLLPKEVAIRKLRWQIAVLISVAIAISYLDRQTLPVAIKAIEKDIPISNQVMASLNSAFLVAYGLMYVGGGKLMDVVGTRLGLP